MPDDFDKISSFLGNIKKENQKLKRTQSDLLGHIGARTVPNAKRKITRERLEFDNTKSQLQEVIGALEVDNWRNAVVKVKSLLNKLESQAIPKWLTTISPAWVGKIPPSKYKTWLHFCKEQFLVALGELEAEAQFFPEMNVEKELEILQELYLTLPPGEFIERISQFVTLPAEEELPED